MSGVFTWGPWLLSLFGNRISMDRGRERYLSLRRSLKVFVLEETRNMSTMLSKRRADFPLEKLCFEREHVGSEEKTSIGNMTIDTSLFKAPTGRPYRAEKKLKLSLSRVPEEEVMTMEIGGPQCGMREAPSGNGCGQEVSTKADAVSDGTPWGNGCWLGLARRRADVQTVSSGDPPAGQEIAAPSASGRPLVQLKIDAMFTGGSAQEAEVRPSKPTDGTPQDGIQHIEARTTAQGLMDVDTAVVSPIDRDEGVPSCYVCTGRLGLEGGDILCAFCDRPACQACSTACAACEITHCSLCLAADFSSQFERYFCPSCYEGRWHNGCQGADGMVD